jgi:hypothetical protein
MTTITLTGDYGYSAYYGSNLPSGTLIDATQASWHLNQSIDPYPFRVYDSVAPILSGGTIWGEASQTADWQDIYINSAAVLIKHSPDAVINNWYVDKPWDAFRINDASTNFLIDDVHVTNARDDAVEDDDMLGGTIRDSLFDGVFSGISLAATSYIDGSANTVTLDHVFMRMEEYLYKGVFEGASPIKADTANPQNVPHLRFIDTVIAIEDPNHMGQNRLQIAWDHTVEVQGSVYLNLSDTPFGPDYPMPPAGFTVLQGQAARDYWDAVKAAWLDNHDGTPIADITPLPPLPGAEPTPIPEPIPSPIPEPIPSPIPEPVPPPEPDPVPTWSTIFFYDTTTGALTYDADGSGPEAPVLIAQLPTALDLSWDFFVL